jgi:sugar phosphate isomerase/epimerase
MKLGVNTVLFGGYDMETAFKYIAMSGYDGVEVSALDKMSKYPILDRWWEVAPEIKRLAQEYGLKLLAMEQDQRIPEIMERAMQLAAEVGIPILNCGPGGKTDEPDTLQQAIDELGQYVEMAEKYGLTLCIKAHVGRAIYNTPTTVKLMKAIDSPHLGIDMDPSHIYRANEDPVEAIASIISRVKHVHIRDCKGRQQGPGKPEMQANGRGDIDLVGYIRVLHEHGYSGPLNLEIIGAKEYSLEQCCIIAAESRGHIQACLQACGAR